MPDQPKSERFKAEMPHIPGVPAWGASRQGMMANPTVRLVAGFWWFRFFFGLAARGLPPRSMTEAPAAPHAANPLPAPASVRAARRPQPGIASVTKANRTSKAFSFEIT